MSISNNYPNVRPSLLLDFANTKTLDPRITFTRASTATYYDGKTVAKAEENLLLQSEDAVSWTPNQLTVTANSTTAPNGLSTADTLTEDTTTNFHRIQPSNVTFVSGLQYTFSVFVKDGDRNFVQLFFPTQFSTSDFANFNISTGALGTVGGGATATITSVGSGWYRCSVTATATSSGSGALSIGLITSSTSARAESYLGSSKFIYVWGAQLEQRSSVTAYTATTTAPITNYIPALQTAASGVARFEHNPTTGESLGLLIEESRTNLLTYSDDFTNGSWTKYPSATTSVTSNTIVAPDGTLTGDQVVGTTSNYEVNKALTKAASAITYTLSGYLKAGSTSSVQLTMSDNSTGQAAVTFNLSTGVISVAASNGTWSGASATITSVGNGWYRCTLTATSPANTGLLPVFNGTGGAGNFFVWGAQLEAGSFATSYIPTTSATVTRSADSASMTGTNFSSWYRADEGTMYAEAICNNNSQWPPIMSIERAGDNSYNTIQLQFYSLGVSQAGLEIGNNAVAQVGLWNTISSRAAFAKVAGSYKTNDSANASNGGTVATDTSCSIPALSEMRIGRNYNGSYYLNGNIKKLAFYPLRLTNAELQGLTTI